MAFVNAQTRQINTSASSIANTGVSITAGNTIVVAVLVNATLAGLSISDTATNSFTPFASNPYFPTGGGRMYAWWCTNCLGNASDIVTVSFTFASVIASMVVMQFSGRNTVVANLIDVTPVTAQDAANTSNHSTGSITTVTAGDDLAAIIGEAFGGATVTATAGSGWTLPASGYVNGSTGQPLGIQYQENKAAGTYSNTWTTSGDSGSLKGQSIILALSPPSTAAPVLASQPNLSPGITGPC